MACPCRRQAEHLLRIFIAWSTRRSFTGRPGRAHALTDRRPPVEAGIDERALCDDRAYSPARRSLPLGGPVEGTLCRRNATAASRVLARSSLGRAAQCSWPAS